MVARSVAHERRYVHTFYSAEGDATMSRSSRPSILLVLVVLALTALPIRAESRPVGAEPTEAWVTRVIPMPKEAEIGGMFSLPVSSVGLTVQAGDDPLLDTVRNVMAPLEEVEGRPFSIRFLLSEHATGLCARQLLERLGALPNADQAYAIAPVYDNNDVFSGLVVVAPEALGLLYGARTLSQMMDLGAGKGTGGRPEISIPELTLVDWPDMSERGMWGSIEKEDLPWLAERKLNIIDHHAVRLSYDEEKGRAVATVDTELLSEAARVGIKVIPIISHLEHIYERSGMAEKRPDLAATLGPSASSSRTRRRTFCFSNPGTVKVIGDWLEDVARAPGVTDIIVWLSEEEWRCSCSDCSGKESYVLETAALLEAFERAKAVHPASSLRILLTQGSYDTNDKILAAVPEDVKLVYYDGGRTYDSSHRPMIYPLLEAFAGSGRWLGVYPQVTNAWRTITPWTAPQFIRYRMNEFVDKGLANVIMYAVPKPRWHQYNITAAAEWLWNSKGRTDEEFSFAYAKSNGIGDPGLFAKWATTVGPVGWDLAGSRVAMNIMHYLDMGAPREGFQSVRYGEMFLAEIHSQEHIDALIRQAEDALALAVEIEDPAAVSETRIHRAFLILARALQVLSEAPASADGLATGRCERYRVAFEQLDYAARTLEVEHVRWAECVDPGERPSRLMDTVELGYRCAALAADVMDRLGIPDPMPEYHLKKVGSWSPEEFADGTERVLSLDVSAAWCGPGPYVLSFESDYRRDLCGIRINDLTLVSRNPDGTETELETIRCNRDLYPWQRWEEARFGFPPIARHSAPLIYVRVEVRNDAPEPERKTYGTVRLRKGIEGAK